MKRRVPRLASDEEAEAFLEADLSDLDFSQFKSGRLRFEDQSGEGRPSETYLLFELAMVEGKRVICMYNGQLREVCPVILGHKDGEERALTYQLAGASASTELSPGGDWRCLQLSKVSEVQLREGPRISGASHRQRSLCISDVDLDVNPDSPYDPRRSLEQLRADRVAYAPLRAVRSRRKRS